jgi:RimJ/RimL family protein N-acetyltransferase
MSRCRTPSTPLDIRGPRVRLRLLRESDIADYERWADPALEAWKLDGPWFNEDPAELPIRARKRLERKSKKPSSQLEIEVDGRHVGWVVVYRYDTDPHMTEVGIDIVEDRLWGQGLGTEALVLWIDHLFRTRGLTRVGLSTWSGNIGMMRAAAKLGMKQEACTRNGCEVGGRFYDRLRYGMLRGEWETARGLLPALRSALAKPADRSVS